MVVILLLTPPYEQHGCESKPAAADANTSIAPQQQQQQPAPPPPPPPPRPPQISAAEGSFTSPSSYTYGQYAYPPAAHHNHSNTPNQPSSHTSNSSSRTNNNSNTTTVNRFAKTLQRPRLLHKPNPYGLETIPQSPPSSASSGASEAAAATAAPQNRQQQSPSSSRQQHEHDQQRQYQSVSGPHPGAPPLPNTQPPYEAYYTQWHSQQLQQQQQQQAHQPNIIPKPPRHQQPYPPYLQHSNGFFGSTPSAYLYTNPVSNNTNPSTAACNTSTTTSDFVRHVTRVNFYDVDTSQVEYIPKDTEDEEGANGDDDCDTEAITKDGEWITKRKTELTTTRQIETRVKRQVLLEDGKVVEDSGPIVSTNTTEDTDKQETETTEKRDLGIPVTDSGGGVQAVTASENPAAGQQLSEFGNAKAVTKMVPRPADGLVRQINDKLVISHEEIKDYTETEDVKHLGDFSDEAYVKAVNSGADNLQEVLLSEANQKQLIPLGPRLIANTSKSRKVIDSEDSEKRCLAQADGKIVTEHKKTTEHEVILDEELPDKDDLSTGSREKVTTKEAHQRFYKQRDEQHVDRLVDGKVISTEMRYAADSMQMEKDSSLERPGDWDSLSDRMRKLRRTNQKSLLQQQKAALLAERKDALTKRPLDFDREEETRKGETMKWLESHFGSESTASNDSRDGDEGPDAAIEPTKKTFFNVTIKSNLGQTPQSHGPPPREARLSATAATDAYERKYHSQVVATGSSGPNTGAPPNSRSKYYQGITNWTERKDQLPAKHFASKAFREDLQDTIERNRLRKMSANGQAVYSSRDKLNSLERERYGGPAAEHAGKVGVASGPNDTYVSRDDILHQKRRQSLSLQFLNKTRRSSSRDHLDDLPEMEPPIAPVAAVNQREPLHNGSFTDLRYGQKVKREEETVHRSSYSSGVKAVVGHPQRSEFIDGRAKSFERGLDMELDHEEHMMMAGGRRGGYDVPKGYQTLKPTTTTSATMRTNGSDSDHLAVNGGSSTLGRPTVPQRRRAIEKKLRQQSSSTTPPLQPPPQGMATPLRKGSYEQQHRDFPEPPPDYSPPPRSRSSSPQVDYNLQRRRRSHSRDRSAHDLDSQGPMPPAAATSISTLQRKQQQRTRFAPEPPSSSYHQQRPTMSTQTTQTIPAAASSSGHKSHSKMGQAIGNSIRKLVSKIRSASAERKMRLKRSKSREQSPSPPHATSAGNATSSTTYQQYNVIDGHIGGAGGGNTESEQESLAGGEPIGAEKMNGYHSNGNKMANGFRRADSADPFISLKDSDGGIANPRQRYYLGEDPYSSRLYGKENHHPHNGNGVGQRQQRIDREQHEEAYTQQRYTSSNTLGRFQKSGGQRAVAGSTPNLHQDYYRTAQTLPRKLHEQTNGSRQPSASPMNSSSRYMTNGSHTLGHPDRRGQYQQATQVAVGPAKPARTYQKVLNRSKSFNVHAMNGGTDPSPIYMEKLTRNNYPATPTSNLHHSQTYKSNPHLFSGGGGGAGGGYRDRLSGERENSLQSGLKSPSIVNLISRSQKDLSKIGTGHDDELLANGHRTPQALASDEKKQIFLRGLHQQAPDLYRTLHGEEVEYREKSPAVRQQLQPKYSLDSRSPIEINKDTASIMRRDSAGANEEYTAYPYGRQMEGQRRFQAFKEEQRRRGSGSTIIELRHTDPRK